MTANTDKPHIFISYSWKPISNKKKTIELAERLSNDGVHVILDEWDLAEGQDKYLFMEQMVNNPDIKRVLLICNQEYTVKANSKKGGVGTESLIMSDEIYKQADQKKFIPIVMERDSDGNEYIPTFIKTRIYIDFSSEEIFEDQYEKLLRNIYDKPANKRPPIGSAPAYITSDEPTYLPTAHKVKSVKSALVNEKANSWVFVDDYFDSFLYGLKQFEIPDEELGKIPQIDDEILKRFEEMLPLRDDFIEFLNVVLKFSPELDMDRFHRFLERMVEYLMDNDSWNHSSNNYGYLKLDHFRIFYYELFLYLTTAFVNHDRFNELSYLLHNSFIVFNSRSQKTEPYDFTIFCNSAGSLNDHRNKRLNLNRVNYGSDLIKQRARAESNLNFERIKEIDCLLYYISIMKNETEDQWRWIRWFPQLTAYRTYQLPLIQRLSSSRHFEKMKSIFDVKTPEELIEKINKAVEIKADRLERWHYELPYIKQAFDLENLGKIK